LHPASRSSAESRKQSFLMEVVLENRNLRIFADMPRELSGLWKRGGRRILVYTDNIKQKLINKLDG
jgi:hypothetical protein